MTARVISASEINEYLSCARKFFYRYRQKRVPKNIAHALDFGRNIHKALELFYKGVYHKPTYAWASLSNLNDKDYQLGASMLSHAEPTLLEDAWEIISVEESFTAPLDFAPGWQLCGQLDLVVRDPADNNIWVVDHKTYSNAPNSAALNLNLQFQLYNYYGARKYGEEFAGLIYNGLCKRVRTPKPPLRIKIPYMGGERWLESVIAPILDGISQNGFAPKPSFACGWCAYASVCEADFMDEDWEFLLQTEFELDEELRYDNVRDAVG